MKFTKFGAEMEAARKERGLSQLELANAICVHPSFYARVERGQRMVSIITFALLWRRLRIDAAQAFATLPVRVAEPNKAQRQRKKQRKRHQRRPFELSATFANFDRTMARARNEAGLTQRELAEAVGMSVSHIGRIESGYGLPSMLAFARMHRVLGFDPNRAIARLLGADLKDPDHRRYTGAPYIAPAATPSTADAPYHGFGDHIRTARAHFALSASHVAQVAGCSLARYHEIERGTMLPTIREVAHIYHAIEFNFSSAMR